MRGWVLRAALLRLVFVRIGGAKVRRLRRLLMSQIERDVGSR